MTPTEKTAIGIGAYGAVLSTITSVIQVVNHRRERTNILVKVRKNMVTSDRMHQKYTIITAVNRGKRPVRIEGFAARQLDTNTNLMFVDIRPQVPHTLEEAQSISAWIAEDVGGLDKVETYFAYDSQHREFECHIIPWFRRLISKQRRKRATKSLKTSRGASL